MGDLLGGGESSMLPMQGTQVRSLVGSYDATCLEVQPKKKKKSDDNNFSASAKELWQETSLKYKLIPFPPFLTPLPSKEGIPF